MKNKQSAVLKWLLLAVCLFAAGCFYSCSGRTKAQNEVVVQESRAVQTERAPGSSGAEENGEKTENWYDAGADPERAGDSREDGSAESASDMELPDETDRLPENSSAAETALLYVYVCGEVQSPGVYTLPEGTRIYEAVDLAGGFTEQAAENWLNLAEPLMDGMKLEVPSRAQVKDPSWQAQNRSAAAENGSGGSAGNSGANVSGQAALVNINTASREELMTLKGIGESRAEDIIRYRKEAGGFTKIEDIMKVPGIKDAAFQKIKENITV